MREEVGIVCDKWYVVSKLILGDNTEFIWDICGTAEKIKSLDLRSSLKETIDNDCFARIIGSYIMRSTASKVCIAIESEDALGVCDIDTTKTLLTETLLDEADRAFKEAKEMFFRNFRKQVAVLNKECEKLD